LTAQDPPESVQKPNKRFAKRVVAEGLSHPWEVAYGPDGMLWVTERSGKRVTRVHPETGERKVAITIDDVSAPGGQDGLMGMALDLARNHVYVAYTYVDRAKGPDVRVADLKSAHRFLYLKIARLTWDPAKETLGGKVDIVTGLPTGDDHNGGRLKLGPDGKLYLSIGDQGGNQFGNFCNPILSQRLPSAKEIAAKNYAMYEGKTLRFNPDGSVPKDNPKFAGVTSHVYTIGHRNTQGLDFAPDGTLYGAEHGPRTDDEVNVLKAGGNYGWPNVAGMKDDKAYVYARWSEAKKPCKTLKYADPDIDPSVPFTKETEFREEMHNPLATMFTVNNGHNFADPACKGVNYICWPTVGVSSVEHYAAGSNGIPGWDRVLLVGTLKRGSLYVLPLTPDGQKAAGKFTRFFHSENRYRDTAVHPGGRTIYVATDSDGLAGTMTGGVTTNMEDRGAILAFTYLGEGDPGSPEHPRKMISETKGPENVSAMPGANLTPQFTTQQVLSGRKAYNSTCAVCHGTTMTNGTYGTPLAGEFFRKKWPGQSVSALYEKSKTTMPPGNPNSLPAGAYAEIVAYILETNGHASGASELPAGGETLKQMRIK
jgi:PQQ-dependent dehydrogenase (s-GDH family)